jgi:hypothetical protein
MILLPLGNKSAKEYQAGDQLYVCLGPCRMPPKKVLPQFFFLNHSLFHVIVEAIRTMLAHASVDACFMDRLRLPEKWY